MDQEQSWLSMDVGNDNNPVVDNYEYFMRPEPRENLGPIVEEFDELLQRTIKTREVRFGMVRNAKDEDKKTAKAYLEPYPHLRIDKAKPLQGWYKSLYEPPGVRNRPCFTEATLTEPYGGYCQVGCAFCYVNAGFRGYRGTGLITVPVNYGDQVRDQLKKMRRSSAGYFSSFTDPFLPLEDLYHNTQRAAEEFVKVGLPIFFLSRLRYPNWAVELLKENKYSYAQKSINTPDPRNWQLLSPGALPLEEHMEDIARLRRNKIYVSIQVNPIVPGVVNHGDVIKLFEKLSKAGANHVIVKFVEAGYSWAGAMVERIKKRFGQEIGEEFESLFTENIGGQKTIEENYRIQGHKLYSTAAKRFGMTYATCYEYRMERDAQGNVINKTGVSIGREYTTAEQCHGQRVPMFTRESADEPFQEVKECPPSGCLYCASENGSTSRCGDTLAGKAPALRLVDLKLPIKREKK